MPVLQYVCKECKTPFEEYVKRHDEEVFCPRCGKKAERCWSGEMFSATGKLKKKCTGNCKTCGGCK